jgi:hypothetical protein
MTLVAGPQVCASCRGEPYSLNCSTIEAWRKVGEWLSLVEHLVRDQGVGGSNPLSPTIFQGFMLPLCYQFATAITTRGPRLTRSGNWTNLTGARNKTRRADAQTTTRGSQFA